MPPADIGTVRTAIAARLATLDSPLVAYGRATGRERLPRSVVVFPAPPAASSVNPDADFYVGTGGAVQYNFELEIWVGLGVGVKEAQDVLDTYISPSASSANSVEGKLEDRTIADDLTSLTTSVKVSPFTRYAYGRLNATGEPNALVATVPVECYVIA